MSHYAQFEGELFESIISVEGRLGPVAEASETGVGGPGLPAAVALVVQRGAEMSRFDVICGSDGQLNNVNFGSGGKLADGCSGCFCWILFRSDGR